MSMCVCVGLDGMCVCVGLGGMCLSISVMFGESLCGFRRMYVSLSDMVRCSVL